MHSVNEKWFINPMQCWNSCQLYHSMQTQVSNDKTDVYNIHSARLSSCSIIYLSFLDFALHVQHRYVFPLVISCQSKTGNRELGGREGGRLLQPEANIFQPKTQQQQKICSKSSSQDTLSDSEQTNRALITKYWHQDSQCRPVTCHSRFLCTTCENVTTVMTLRLQDMTSSSKLCNKKKTLIPAKHPFILLHLPLQIITGECYLGETYKLKKIPNLMFFSLWN